MSACIPRVFISYSRTSIDRVIEIAQRLMGDGVDVVLDKWELKEGQDKNTFMERSVTDQTIDKVLMICDKVYAEKANDREGGVGDETMVISPEVYDKTTETKYVPIIIERNDDGKAYVPAYLKSRIYIDLCADNELFEQEYEKLLRNLYDKPELKKPVLGEMPEWLNDENVDLSGVRSLLKQIKAYDGKNRNGVELTARRFCDEFIKAMFSFSPEQGEDFDKKLLVQIDASKPLRDIYFDYIEAVIMSDLDVGSVIGDSFEQIFNGTFIIEGRNTYNEFEFEFSQFLIWEMFIGSTAILLYFEKFQELNDVLYRTYFLAEDPVGRNIQAYTFVKFHPTLRYIDERIKPKSDTPNLTTLAGEILIKHEKQPIITQQSLVNADTVLYQLSCVLEYSEELFHWHWFPTLYIYSGHPRYYSQPLWSKMVSLKYCKKLLPLFGVTEVAQLKKMINESTIDSETSYPGMIASAASIQRSIKPDKIGSMQ